MASRPTTREIAAALDRRGVPYRLLGGGQALVTLDCGRVLSLSTSLDSPNFFWTHPDVIATDMPLADLIGGAGGERLWIGPELDYFWDGVPDWDHFSNYRKQASIDPGIYSFGSGDAAIVLSADMTLESYRDHSSTTFNVQRCVEHALPPVAVPDLSFAGIRLTNQATFADSSRVGTIDLWQVLQVSPGSQMVVPMLAREDPLPYGRAGTWRNLGDRVVWTFTGTESAKLGLSAGAVTGRAASFYQGTDGACELIVRDFSFDDAPGYVDHPHGVPRTDQVFQAWDGFGFGELEVRSRGIDAAVTRTYATAGAIWAYAGPEAAVCSVSEVLLGLEFERSPARPP